MFLLPGADPYCVIRCDGRKVTTPVQNDTLNPKFNAGGLFYVRNINGEIVIDVSVAYYLDNRELKI